MVLLSKALESAGSKAKVGPERANICEEMETTPNTAAARESQAVVFTEMVGVVAQGYKSDPSPDPVVPLPSEYTGNALMVPPLSLRSWKSQLCWKAPPN